MSKLSPQVAAELDEKVYDDQSETFLSLFLSRPGFSQKSSNRHPLKAEVGSRLINTLDGFGICAVGGKGYEYASVRNGDCKNNC